MRRQRGNGMTTNGKIKTPIIDKNGKATTVYKSPDKSKDDGRKLPVATTSAQDPIEVKGRAIYGLLKNGLGLDGYAATADAEDEFIEHLRDWNGEKWLSGKLGQFKLLGSGNNQSPFHLQTRAASRVVQTAVDEINAGMAEIVGTRAPAKITPERYRTNVENGTVVVQGPNGPIVLEGLPAHREPVEDDELVVASEAANGEIIVKWAVADDDPGAYPFMEGDSFHEFQSEQSRDDFIESKKAEGVDPSKIFIVDKYDHSSVHYSIHDSASYPDRRWDTAPSGVFIVDEKGESGAVPEQYEAQVTAVLEEYSSWANGDTYGIAQAVVDSSGEVIQESEVWGYVGTESIISDFAENDYMH